MSNARPTTFLSKALQCGVETAFARGALNDLREVGTERTSGSRTRAGDADMLALLASLSGALLLASAVALILFPPLIQALVVALCAISLLGFARFSRPAEQRPCAALLLGEQLRARAVTQRRSIA